MSSRTYVVILFFWALLTIVTPMLVRLSASANLYATFDGERKEGMNKLSLPRRALIAEIVSPAPSPSPAPAPAPSPISVVEVVFSDKLKN
ncbi:hypothetical protein CDL12_14310 [Handroanthus impetiginosus]|uniref:Uncharacterized protein n=1 Tax=Handroanthus impetiginosus TaxID=429701 RepID=A0A2G9H6B6_9LAMI|nr:hypothetical protein CDL12_21235 [Handroanthus impetiginosus]PIN13064.1 hypothetical protein CDL12_14310 [Handroanthus impetiginosus]